MAKKKSKKKASILGLIMLFVVVACAGVAIGGIFVEWLKIDGWDDSGVLLSDTDEINSLANKFGIKSDLYDAMSAMAYLAVAVICAVAVAYLVKQLINIKLFRFVVAAGGILAVVAGVISIALTAQLSKDFTVLILKVIPSYGAYMTSIGTIAGGLAAFVGCLRK